MILEGQNNVIIWILNKAVFDSYLFVPYSIGQQNGMHNFIKGMYKGKVKVAFWSFFNTEAIFGLLYSCSQQVPAFISRGATHHTDARDLYRRRRKLLPNFARKFEFTDIS